MIKIKDIRYFMENENVDKIYVHLKHQIITIEDGDSILSFNNHLKIEKKKKKYNDKNIWKEYIIPLKNILYLSLLYKE